MLNQRLLAAAILIPIGVVMIFIGGWFLALVLAAGLGYAAWEYYRLFLCGGYKPSATALIGGVVLLALLRQQFAFAGTEVFFSVIVLLAMGVQVAHYEKGNNTAAVDFNITLGGILYLGWLGAYLSSVRQLPSGEWWLLLILPACWINDGGAYFVGRTIGRHKLSQRVSPNKSWEGYIGGIVVTAITLPLLAAVFQQFSPEITPLKGLIIGVVIAVITPMGDLGESMLKRGVGVKDSGHVIPGHGGVMDRIDSWLWAVPIGYYLITWFF